MSKRHSRPINSEDGCFLATEEDALSAGFLGVSVFEGVGFTVDQKRRLYEFYDVEDDTSNELMCAASFRAAARDARTDGLRIMAYLAGKGVLEAGDDPVRLIENALFDLFRGGSAAFEDALTPKGRDNG